MSDKYTDLETQLEMASLLPNRHYIVLKQAGEDNFTLSAYDTSNPDPSEEFYSAAFVAQHGLIAILREETEYVIDKGMEELEHMYIAEAIEDSAEPDSNVAKVARRTREGNVVKVDFGAKQ